MTITQPASDLPVPPPISPERTLNSAQWGMASFLLSEVAFFATLIAAYVAFMGKDVVGPTPAQALSLPLVIVSTICLLSSSVVIHLAERSLDRGHQRTFCMMLAATIALGIAFLVGTAVEWRSLINEHQLTISRNLFGTTYYTLVGFHGLHVTIGVIAMLIVLALSFGRELTKQNRTGVGLVAWYWHFVDAVWIVVFLVVYVASPEARGMMNESNATDDSSMIEMPRPTAAPLVLAAGIALAAMGVATSLAFLLVGVIVFIVGLGMWIAQLLPGRGHVLEPRVEPSLRPQPVTPAPGEVERLRRGTPGYRLRLPVKVHPISAGIKGGLVGGLVMPLPAIVYGVMSGHGIWWPVNLLAGIVIPGVGSMSVNELEQFHPTLLGLGIFIHIVVSLILGLIYGVLMPTLPSLRRPIAWGAVLMPLLWTAVSYIALGAVNPGVREGIEWPWFILSQFVFGLVAAIVFTMLEVRGVIKAGLIGGAVGGLLMPIPALLWSLAAGHGIWYPVNLLAAMATRYEVQPTAAQLEQFHADWFVAALVIHAILSLSFGLAFAIVLPRMPAIPGPLAWGALLMPLLWTAMSYGMMGVVNPVLQERVDWPWFVASQFVFGIAAAIVILRSEEFYIPPAGAGPDQAAEFIAN